MAEGVSQFRIPLLDAARLVASLQGNLPGYMIPKLALDLPGGHGKIILTENSLEVQADGSYVFRSPLSGMLVVYPAP